MSYLKELKEISKTIDELNTKDSLGAKETALNAMAEYKDKFEDLTIDQAIVEINEELHQAYKIIYWLKTKI